MISEAVFAVEGVTDGGVTAGGLTVGELFVDASLFPNEQPSNRMAEIAGTKKNEPFLFIFNFRMIPPRYECDIVFGKKYHKHGEDSSRIMILDIIRLKTSFLMLDYFFGGRAESALVLKSLGVSPVVLRKTALNDDLEAKPQSNAISRTLSFGEVTRDFFASSTRNSLIKVLKFFSR